MARIRTIKPEFPQSQSIGRVSRDARVLFIMMWTIADDEGRGRGAPKMLASLLFPYDDDAPGLVEDWLQELVEVGCIILYEVENTQYFQIVKWREHQKIDRPTPSRLPGPDGALSHRNLEKDIELALAAKIKSTGKIFGEVVLDVRRQVRIGSSYLDIVVKAGDKTFVIELKRGPLATADIDQVLRYAGLTEGIPVLVGRGLSAQFSVAKCRESGVAAICVDDDLRLSVKVSSKNVKACDLTLENIRERHRSRGNARECQPGDLDLDQGARTSQEGEDLSFSSSPNEPVTVG